ncbi:MAG TPA: hypothetical protein PLT06_06090 [Syntrophorhabdaceae bacterium]|nr:hypothetical protein [Syntrophorhabdaceae bacterium]HQI56879.1 hypothetical protein [Syntrophorhabdaceae bacterium]HQJ94392.1 hypothetical protein [Syntrophorhabdaceae bacterium]
MTLRRNDVSNDFTLNAFRESIKSFLRQNNIEISAALVSYGFFAILPLNLFTVRGFCFPTNYKFTWGILCLTMIVESIMKINVSLRTVFLKIFNIEFGIIKEISSRFKSTSDGI